MCLKNQRGFTLIEVLASLTILVLLTAAALQVYQHGLLSWKEEEKVLNVQDNLRISMDRMAREIRQARSLDSSSSTSRVIIYDTGNQKIVYSIEDNTLYRKAGSSVKQPVAGSISCLSFEYGPGNLVTITAAGKTKELEEITYTTAVCIRTGSEDI
ncbi:MAG: prepilin-type N-terminal cleavage/methylation domain-containing protein [Clostridiales bacterium]|nr:prepilin-type N-terminal cleavage/methylation domain-containing protein [Clostridiales bacterium]